MRTRVASASSRRPQRATAPGIRIGCAGWSIPKGSATEFPAAGSHLERYAARFEAAEIDTSFYRAHRVETYARWAQRVPPGFRYAVKLPRTITHEQRLARCAPLLDAFLGEVAGLGERLGCLLIQLPPSLAYDRRTFDAFVRALRARCDRRAALEPRHASWFEPAVDARLRAAGIARVAADPARVPAAAEPGGCEELVYFRLHGSPEMYRSPYGTERLRDIAASVAAAAAGGADTWCIFDNTMLGAATSDALELQRLLRVGPRATRARAAVSSRGRPRRA